MRKRSREAGDSRRQERSATQLTMSDHPTDEEEVLSCEPEPQEPETEEEQKKYTKFFSALKVDATLTLRYCRRCLEHYKMTEKGILSQWRRCQTKPFWCYKGESYGAMRRHFNAHESGLLDPFRQTEMTEYLLNPADKEDLQKRLVRFMCALNLSVRFVDDPNTQSLLSAGRNPLQALGLVSGEKASYRRAMRDALLATSAELKKKLFQRLKQSNHAVLLAIDGGTISRKLYMNVVVCHQETSYLLVSKRCRGRMTGEWIREQLLEVLRELRKEGIQVIAVCADNAANYQKGVRQVSGFKPSATLRRFRKDKAVETGEETNEEEEEEDGDEDEDVEVGESEDEQGHDENSLNPEFQSDSGFVNLFEEALEGLPTDVLEREFSFLVPVRCYAHSLQLVMGDVIEKNFEEILNKARQVHAASKSRQNQQILSEIADENDFAKWSLHDPCVTRWNSNLRLLIDILEVRNLLMLAANGNPRSPFSLSDDDYAEIELAVLVLSPLAWATDTVQGDDFSVDQCIDLHNRILADYEALSNLLKSRERKDVVQRAIRALNNRKPLFRNKLVCAYQTLKALGTVDGPIPKALVDAISEVSKLLLLYGLDALKLQPPHAGGQSWIRRRIKFPEQGNEKDFLEKLIAEELSSATAKNFSGWQQTFLVRNFLDDVKSVLVTEASVERSFQMQNEIQRPKRCRMKEDLKDALLFTRMNMDKLDYRCVTDTAVERILSKRKPRVQLLRRSDWETLASKLGTGEFVSQRVMTRQAKKNEAIAQLKPGARIEVMWHENNQDRWFAALVLGENPKERGTYFIFYDCDQKEGGQAQVFLPFSKDHQFRVLKPA